MLDHGPLCRRHLIVAERLEPVATQAEAAGVGALRVGGLSGGDADEGEGGGANDQQSNHDVFLSPQMIIQTCNEQSRKQACDAGWWGSRPMRPTGFCRPDG